MLLPEFWQETPKAVVEILQKVVYNNKTRKLSILTYFIHHLLPFTPPSL